MSGIVRKIDELGRIVIPKEIRKVLNIDSGSSISIKVNNGCVILSKFMPLKRLKDYISNITDSLYEKTDMGAIIADEDNILSCSGVSKEFCDKKLLQSFKKVAINQCLYNEKVLDIIGEQNSKFFSMYVSTICDETKIVGYIILVGKVINKQITPQISFCCDCIANYLTKLL